MVDLSLEGTDYRKLLAESFSRFAVLFKQREDIDVELMKVRQFIHATINMLPDGEREVFNRTLDELANQMGGLTDAIRDVLKLARAEHRYVTATQVRDNLVKAKFDFSRYSSNPLASVNTVLKRMKPDEVETTTVEGVAAYRARSMLYEALLKTAQDNLKNS